MLLFDASCCESFAYCCNIQVGATVVREAKSQLQKKGMFFVAVEKGGETELVRQVAQHCKRFSLPEPGVLVDGAELQETIKELKKVLFHLGVNPLLWRGEVRCSELCTPISEEERRKRKRTVALTTAGVSVAVGGGSRKRRMRCSFGGSSSSSSQAISVSFVAVFVNGLKRSHSRTDGCFPTERCIHSSECEVEELIHRSLLRNRCFVCNEEVHCVDCLFYSAAP